MLQHANNLDSFDERLRKLERENRWLKRGGAAMLLLFGTFLVMGQAPVSRTVQAQSFELRDAGGNLRASLTLDNGEPLLKFYEDGNVRVALGTSTLPDRMKTPGLILFGANGAIRMNAGLHNGDPMITMTDSHGVPGLGVSMLGGPSLSFYEDHGNTLTTTVFLSSFGEGPSLRLLDRAGFSTYLGSTELETTRTGESHRTSAASVVLFDSQNKVVWRTP